MVSVIQTPFLSLFYLIYNKLDIKYLFKYNNFTLNNTIKYFRRETLIRIITDSTCDLPKDMQESLNIDIMPLTVHFGEDCYKDGIELTNQDFYKMLAKADKLPTTSQVNPEDFVDIFKKYIDNGDEVLGVFLSSKLSGTCQSAFIAKGMLESDKIHIIDTSTVTFGLGFLITEAVKMRDNNKPINEIISKLENMSKRIKLILSLSTLKYLKMGGRLSKTSAILGTILGISPIIMACDGVVSAVGKTRGKKAALKALFDILEKENPDYNQGVAFGHSNAVESLSEFTDLFPKELVEKALCTNMGCIVGTHAGPGAYGIAFLTKE